VLTPLNYSVIRSSPTSRIPSSLMEVGDAASSNMPVPTIYLNTSAKLIIPSKRPRTPPSFSSFCNRSSLSGLCHLTFRYVLRLRSRPSGALCASVLRLKKFPANRWMCMSPRPESRLISYSERYRLSCQGYDSFLI
jgi:hypothetical protein